MSEDTTVQETEQQEEVTEDVISKAEHERLMAIKDKAIREAKETESDDLEEDVLDEDAIVQRATEAAKRALREEQANLYKDASHSWMKEQPWGERYNAENDPEGSQYSKLNEALKTVSSMHPITSVEDYNRNLQLANQLVTGSVDNSAQAAKQSVQKKVATQMASGGGGYDVKREHEGGSEFSDAERKMIEKISGKKPEDINRYSQ